VGRGVLGRRFTLSHTTNTLDARGRNGITSAIKKGRPDTGLGTFEWGRWTERISSRNKKKKIRVFLESEHEEKRK